MAYESYTDARKHLKNVLDTAEQGRPVLVQREDSRLAVVDAERLRLALGKSCRRPAVVYEAGGCSVFLPGVPVAADGADLDDAIEEMVTALREYAQDWQDRVGDAPNHRSNWGLVQLVALSDDVQLKEWLVGSDS